MATRLAGSSDLYQASGRRPYHSINFITSHDGFTLHDLVSYGEKHNEANGENNRDGDNNNNSDNYGVEGPTRKSSIDKVRVRQIKNEIGRLRLEKDAFENRLRCIGEEHTALLDLRKQERSDLDNLRFLRRRSSNEVG